jgi:hypothetical protein
MAPATSRYEDNYLACSEYAGQPGVGASGHEGLVAFRHNNGQYYFAWYAANGNVLMRSEGYPTAAARDNGMASVARNRDNDARYSIVEKNGNWFVVLQAGNYQEIARSCPYKSRSQAEALLPRNRVVADALVAESTMSVRESEALRLKNQAEELLGKSEGISAQRLY